MSDAIEMPRLWVIPIAVVAVVAGTVPLLVVPEWTVWTLVLSLLAIVAGGTVASIVLGTIAGIVDGYNEYRANA